MLLVSRLEFSKTIVLVFAVEFTKKNTKNNFTRFRGWNLKKSILFVFAAGILKLRFYLCFAAASAAAAAAAAN